MKAGNILSLLILMAPALLPASADPKGLKVITTFPNLRYDVELLACPSDEVISLAPIGVDPHEYELRPQDVSLLAKANIVISTAHTPFEKLIRSKVESGEIGAELMEIPNLDIRLLRNPATGQPNYHMPVYDPDNYLIFMSSLKELMSRLNPGCSEHYEKRFESIREEVLGIERKAQKLRLNITAAAVSPAAQYAVQWAGVKVKYLLLREEGVPATPPELAEIRRKALAGDIGLMVLVGSTRTQLNEKALEMAKEIGLPYITVPSPLEPRSIPEKLRDVVAALSSLERASGSRAEAGSDYLYLALILVIIIALLSATIWIIRKQFR